MTPDVMTWTAPIAGVDVFHILFREDIEPIPQDRIPCLQKSFEMPVLFECSGGLRELYSKGKLLKQFDRSESVHIEKHGDTLKVVDPLDLAPFDTKRDLVQLMPEFEKRWQ